MESKLLDTPIFIISRDRLSVLRYLIKELERFGHHNIYLVDCDSAYEPLLEFYEKVDYPVFKLDNVGPIAPWRVPQLAEIMEKERFVVTDPDVYPNEECPPYIMERMHWILDNTDHIDKVGPCLNIFDLPDHYAHADEAEKWEKQFWRIRGPHNTWNAPIDTTFALHRPGTPYKITEALRLNRPFMFDHGPWYLDFDALPEDEAFYIGRLNPQISNWNRLNLPKDHVI